MNDHSKIRDFKNEFDLADIELVIIDLNKNTAFECKIRKLDSSYYLKAELNFYWKIEASQKHFMNYSDKMGTNQRIFVDETFRLIINNVQYSDFGIYTCYLNEEIKAIILLKINFEIINSIFNFLNHFGVFLIIFTLLMVVLFSLR